MDVNDLRIAVTVVSLIAFLGLMAWAGLRRHRLPFEEAARLALADDSKVPTP
jgi:cytochrome c oxidase cbb3-type subunit IV